MIVILASPCVESQVPRWVHPRWDELEGLFRGRQTLEAVPSPAQPRLAPRSGALLSPASLNLKPRLARRLCWAWPCQSQALSAVGGDGLCVLAMGLLPAGCGTRSRSLQL